MNIGKKLIVGALAVVGAWCAQAEEKCTDCITFSADKAFGIRLNKGTDTTTPTVALECSTDQLNWKTFNVDTGYNAEPDGETYKLHIRGTGNSKFAAGASAKKSHSFTNTVGSAATAIACSGNALTLLDYATVAKGEEPTMESYAFYSLFSGFAALTAAPALPATTLAKGCYLAMFRGCTSLTTAPALPATTLAESCYQNMFFGCTSLTSAPALPATTLAASCYGTMFRNCTSLVVNSAAPGKEWKIAATPGTGVTTWGPGMFDGTGGTLQGTPALSTPYYIASAPKETDCITFSADKSFGIKMVKGAGSKYQPAAPAVNLEYSTDQLNWSTFSVNTDYAAAKDGETFKLHIRGTGNTTFAAGLVQVSANVFTLANGSAATAIACSGNVMTLLDYGKVSKGEALTMGENAFAYLFYGFTALTSAPELPATTLTSSCYGNMFQGCTSLTAAPELPATKLQKQCYSQMFDGCTSLTAAPALPVTTLAGYCYMSMFRGCTSLTVAPALPATTLADSCYGSMFDGCTSLTAAPALNATTLAERCYQYMFQDCTSLTAAPALPATTLAVQCYTGMFKGCTSLTAAPALNATTLANGCYASMFSGCTSLTTAPALPATTLAKTCYSLMFNGCTSLVVNTAAPGKEWKIAATPGEGVTSWGYNMFAGTGGNIPSPPDLNKTYYIASAPKETDCITFSADKSFGIKMRSSGGPSFTPSLEYSTDQLNWTKVTVDSDYAAKQDGETYKIHFRGTGNKKLSESMSKNHAFTNTATSAATAIACSGNALTLLDYGKVAKGEEPTMESYAFYSLFSGFAALTAAPALPATTLTNNCYIGMFKGCTSLTAAPALPATTLANYCYNAMFYGCTSLTAAPALPATTLANGCYNSMFQGCTSLVVNTAAPGKEWKIAATPGTGVTSWGSNMFAGTGGDVPSPPDLNTTYYVGAKKEVVGDVTLYRYGDQVGVSVAGELTKALADSIKDQGITNLVVGAGVTGVGAGAFEGWRSLRDVTISTNCTAIGADAFHRCQNVTNVTVQADETVAVGDYAFYRCNSLEKLSFAHLPSWGETPFSFYSAIYMKDGIPEVYAIPTVEAGTAKQKLYGTNKLEGKSTEWTEIETEEQKTQFHFFKIALEM